MGMWWKISGYIASLKSNGYVTVITCINTSLVEPKLGTKLIQLDFSHGQNETNPIFIGIKKW